MQSAIPRPMLYSLRSMAHNMGGGWSGQGWWEGYLFVGLVPILARGPPSPLLVPARPLLGLRLALIRVPTF